MDSDAALSESLRQAVDCLRRSPIGSYHADGPAASEPTAWATIALASNQESTAVEGAEWLGSLQARDGSVGVTQHESTPAWTTALAILAWRAVNRNRFAERIDRAAAWAVEQLPWTRPCDPLFGHDTTIEGWSWAPDTHSWLEPTAFFVAALRGSSADQQTRRNEGVRMLADRLLPSGGANYGNTTVFGQELLQHVHSSGVAAWALGGEKITDRTDESRLVATLNYLEAATQHRTGVASLAWAVRGLAAHNRVTDRIVESLAAAWPDVQKSGSLHKTALFALAAQACFASPSLPLATHP